MSLYGIYGRHTPEGCPLYNKENRDIIIKIEEKLNKIANKNSVKILEQYHSALEHEFTWIVDAKGAHQVQSFMIESQWAKFNTMKIVPLGTYEELVGVCKGLGIE